MKLKSYFFYNSFNVDTVKTSTKHMQYCIRSIYGILYR